MGNESSKKAKYSPSEYYAEKGRREDAEWEKLLEDKAPEDSVSGVALVKYWAERALELEKGVKKLIDLLESVNHDGFEMQEARFKDGSVRDGELDKEIQSAVKENRQKKLAPKRKERAEALLAEAERRLAELRLRNDVASLKYCQGRIGLLTGMIAPLKAKINEKPLVTDAEAPTCVDDDGDAEYYDVNYHNDVLMRAQHYAKEELAPLEMELRIWEKEMAMSGQ